MSLHKFTNCAKGCNLKLEIGCRNLKVDNTINGTKLQEDENKNITLGTSLDEKKEVVTGENNISIGYNALADNVTGHNNISIGNFSGNDIISGNNNIFLGGEFKENGDTSNSNNILIGFQAGIEEGTGSHNHKVIIATSAINPLISASADLENVHWSPADDGNTDLGITGQRWRDIYSINPVTVGSDRNIKDEIENTPLGLDFINRLRPVVYKLKDRINKYKSKTEVVDEEIVHPKTKKRLSIRYEKKIKDLSRPLTDIIYKTTNQGFIAQEVEENLTECGFDPKKFNGLVYPKSKEDIYSLRYQEFIAPIVKAIQELTNRLETIETLASHFITEKNEEDQPEEEITEDTLLRELKTQEEEREEIEENKTLMDDVNT